MKRFLDSRRYEIKYRLPNQLIPAVREHLRGHVVLDPHTPQSEQDHYTVRSIYFDTPDLDFYHEKREGLKIRKKLRVRGYNEENGYAFLEIKRKYTSCIVKERARLPLAQIEKIVGDPGNSSLDSLPGDHQVRLVSGKFLYSLLKRRLVATLLVVYDREPYLSLVENRTRVTIDTNVGARLHPSLNDLFHGTNLIPVTNHVAILELKFNDFMPQWMRAMTRDLGIRYEAISKYCMGIDACRI